MSTLATTAAIDDDGPARRHFTLRRLHSLSGVIPTGVFLLAHLWTNASALDGRDAFNHAVGEIQSTPALPAIELFGIALPLTFHAVYGLVITARSTVNTSRYAYTRNWLYVLQRVSGVIAFGFIALHLWQLRVPKATGALRWQSFYDALGTSLAAPAVFAMYLAGVTASVFHFANGLWLFGNTWGVTVGARSMRRSAALCGALGLALWALGFNTLLHFSYRCGGVLPRPAQQVERVCRDGDTAMRPDQP